MPGLSVHVVDVSRGIVATGLRVELWDLSADAMIADGRIDAAGTLPHPALSARFEPGSYEARFHVADYYRDTGQALPVQPFLDVVGYRFGIGDAAQHYHLPFKMTPWGYSCFRGGA
jgi:5-hydroxyisourate hydrolase